ncbi:MAG: hypothetical protein JNG90_01660 [Planctomycetaceae bacterium]|nr:hypothetical protein [Planctomycetaceae bacterium]
MDAPPPSPDWQPRFTLATLFKIVIILSVLTGVLGGLLRESASGSVSIVFFLAMVIAAPLAITIGVSLVDPVSKLLAGRRRKRK